MIYTIEVDDGANMSVFLAKCREAYIANHGGTTFRSLHDGEKALFRKRLEAMKEKMGNPPPKGSRIAYLCQQPKNIRIGHLGGVLLKIVALRMNRDNVASFPPEKWDGVAATLHQLYNALGDALESEDAVYCRFCDASEEGYDRERMESHGFKTVAKLREYVRERVSSRMEGYPGPETKALSELISSLARRLFPSVWVRDRRHGDCSYLKRNIYTLTDAVLDVYMQ